MSSRHQAARCIPVLQVYIPAFSLSNREWGLRLSIAVMFQGWTNVFLLGKDQTEIFFPSPLGNDLPALMIYLLMSCLDRHIETAEAKTATISVNACLSSRPTAATCFAPSALKVRLAAARSATYVWSKLTLKHSVAMAWLELMLKLKLSLLETELSWAELQLRLHAGSMS